MKKKSWITLFIIIILSIGFLTAMNFQYKNNIKDTKAKIEENHLNHMDILYSYTQRVNKGESNVKEELENLISTSTDILYEATYTNALSYYYLRYNDKDKMKELALKSIEMYDSVIDGVPLVLETYSYLIKNLTSVNEYSSALKYCYEAMDYIDNIDINYVNEKFIKEIEVIVNCTFINIFYYNDIYNQDPKYFNFINDLKEDDPIYKKYKKMIAFSKILYQDGKKNYEEALKYSKQYFEISKAENSPEIEGMKINIAIALLKANRPDEALEYLLAAEKHYRDTPQRNNYANVLITYGDYYMQKENYLEAYNNYQNAYNIYIETDAQLLYKKDAIKKLNEANSKGNLNFDISTYLEEYITISSDENSNEDISNLFVTMDEIANKSYDSKVLHMEQEKIALKKASKDKVLLIFFLVTLLILFAISTKHLYSEVKKRKIYEKRLLDTLKIDYLTNCLTRTHGISVIESLIRKNTKFSLAIIDIDNFKQINDTYGHPVGDEVLKIFGEELTKTNNNLDHVIRYGGEEFLIVLENKGVNESLKLIEEFKEKLSKINSPTNSPITFSGGLKESNNHTFDTLLNEVDALLYEAKKNGKNRISI